MELHKAIKEILESYGVEILYENRLLNILSDYKAFEAIPSSKIILRSIISEGYCQKLLDLGTTKRDLSSSWQSSNKSLLKPEEDMLQIMIKGFVDSINKQNGFSSQLVEYVLMSVIYGLEWTNKVPIVPNLQSKPVINNVIQPKQQLNSNTTSGVNTNKSNSISYQQITDTQFLVMRVNPLNASVYVDGQQQFVSNGIMAVELHVGQHTYEVKADLYETISGSVDINSSHKTEIEVELSLEKKLVKLAIEAEDNDAEIIINGVIYGKGKWEGLVEEGTYDIEVNKFRYYPFKQSISIIGIDKQKIAIPLLKPICGNLKVNVQPYGARIHINKEYKGDTPLLVKDILIGERKLYILTKEGTSYETTVVVKENQTTDVNHIIPSLFLYDYSEVKLGDYFYEDGSFSHERAFGKEAVGVVFNLNPSEEEKKKGWTHGQIVALNNTRVPKENNYRLSWGIANKEMLANAIQNPENEIDCKDNGYMLTHMDSVLNNPEFEPFVLAAEYEAKLPYGITSGWYLPCIAQLKILQLNLKSKMLLGDFIKLKESYKSKYVNFATSSIFNKKEAWKYEFSYDQGRYHKASISNYATFSYLDEDRVRAVASF